MLPEFPAGKAPASLSLDPCDTEEVDFEENNIIPLSCPDSICLGVRAPGHEF